MHVPDDGGGGGGGGGGGAVAPPPGGVIPGGSHQISATGPVYRGPGAGAAGPLHHYVFELMALDIQLDVPPTGDAFATRKSLMAAIDGHIIGKAVYTGRFRRPQ